MARTTGTDPLESEKAQLVRSESQLNLAKIQEIANSRESDNKKLQLMEREIADKMQMSREETAGRQRVAETDVAGRKDVANIDVASRNRTANLDLAAKLLDQIRLAKDSDAKSKTDFLSDLSRMPTSTPELVAGTAAEMGNPAALNALNRAKANQIDNLIRADIPAFQKADEAKKISGFKAKYDALDPNAFERLKALAYPNTAGPNPTDLTIRRPVTSLNAPVSASQSTADVVNQALTSALAPATSGGPTLYADNDPSQGISRGGGVGGNLPSGLGRVVNGEVIGTPPVGPPGTADAWRVNSLKAAGAPYVEGGMVHNQPAGTEGYDFNTNTGKWVSESNLGTINGRPSAAALLDSAMRTGKAPVYASDEIYNAYQAARNSPNRYGIEPMTTGAPPTIAAAQTPATAALASTITPNANQYNEPIGPTSEPAVMANPTQYPTPIGPTYQRPLVPADYIGNVVNQVGAAVNRQNELRRSMEEAARRAAEEEARRRAATTVAGQ